MTRIFVLLALALLGPAAVLAQATPQVDSSHSAVPPLIEYQFAPEQLKRSAALYRTRLLTYVVGTVYGIVLLLVLLNLKVAVRFRDVALQTSPRRFVQAFVFTPLLIFTVLSVVSQPLSSGISRHMEHQVDVYALEVLHGLVPDSTQAATQAFQKLGEKALAYPAPHPLYVWWAYSHPTIAERLRFAANYQPWSHGEAQFIR